MPTFVLIVSGLTANRSPALITTHRYPWTLANRRMAVLASTCDAATLICPLLPTRSEIPSGSGTALSAVIADAISPSRSSRATSGRRRAGDDLGDRVHRGARVRASSDDADAIARRGAQREERGDAPGVRALASRLDRDLSLVGPRPLDDEGRRTPVKSPRIRD